MRPSLQSLIDNTAKEDRLMWFPNNAMQDVGQVASHNTYANYSPADWTDVLGTVCSVELDVFPQWDWRVAHVDGSPGSSLKNYLSLLAAWQKKKTKHPPVTVFLEMKNSTGWRVSDFESEILGKAFPDNDNLYRPADYRRWAHTVSALPRDATLRQLVNDVGWPSYMDPANKIMFVLNSADNDVITTYLDEAGDEPTCFVMTRPGAVLRPKYTDEVVIFNETYDAYSRVKASEKNCLRRAWQVNVGNNELADGHGKKAGQAMKDKQINFLAYDVCKNAFAFALTGDPPD